MPIKDPEKRRANKRAWYRKNADRVKKDIARRNVHYRDNLTRFIDRVKLRYGCSRCGYKRCAKALHFHHTKDDKINSISRVRRNAGSIRAAKVEMRKCMIVCANCHAEIHDRTCR